jgi:probable phosphoglycerate mutase
MSVAKKANSELLSGRETCTATIYTWRELYARLGACVDGPPLHIDIIRHAESEANARGLVAGKWDARLSKRGRLQAYRLGLALKHAPYLFAWSSSLYRTSATLQYAASLRRISAKPLCTDARLDERGLGELERQPRRYIPAYARGDLRYAPPGGESYLELAQRVLSFLVDLRETLRMESSVLIATHVGPMRIIAGALNGMTESAEVLRLSFSHARPYHFDLQTLNWPKFLDPKEVLSDGAKYTHSKHERDLATSIHK